VMVMVVVWDTVEIEREVCKKACGMGLYENGSDHVYVDFAFPFLSLSCAFFSSRCLIQQAAVLIATRPLARCSRGGGKSVPSPDWVGGVIVVVTVKMPG
jgi:hypothetical protein